MAIIPIVGNPYIICKVTTIIDKHIIIERACRCMTYIISTKYHGWLVVWNIFYFPISWEFHHPHWRTLIFFRGVGEKPPTRWSTTITSTRTISLDYHRLSNQNIIDYPWSEYHNFSISIHFSYSFPMIFPCSYSFFYGFPIVFLLSNQNIIEYPHFSH